MTTSEFSPLHSDEVAKPLVSQLVRDNGAYTLSLLAGRLGLP